jgi:hypothetical protein
MGERSWVDMEETRVKGRKIRSKKNIPTLLVASVKLSHTQSATTVLLHQPKFVIDHHTPIQSSTLPARRLAHESD